VRELLNNDHPNLDVDIDPKLSWALRNMHEFPINVNTADMRMLARIPGMGMKSVHKIINARRYRKLSLDHLKAIGVALNRAKYFIVCDTRDWRFNDLDPERIKSMILQGSQSKYQKMYNQQMRLF
jgi:predicted DNA-binding helix-hairpin-helix protein